MTVTSSEYHTTLALTPRGRLLVVQQNDAPTLDSVVATRIREAFDKGSGHGILHLGAVEVGQVLPPVFSYWRDLGGRFMTALCTRPNIEQHEHELPPFPDELETLVLAAPLMPGAEYLSFDMLRRLWNEVGEAFTAQHRASKLALPDFLKRLNPAWNVVGRVHFNLAENRKDEQAPFAFLATYTHRLSAHGKAQRKNPPLSRTSKADGNPSRYRVFLVG